MESLDGGWHVICDHAFDRLVVALNERGERVRPEFGESELATHTDHYQKVVLAPGGSNRELGKFFAPDRPGGEPRALARLDELFRIYVAAFDPKADEAKISAYKRAQYRETRRLFDIVFAILFTSTRAFTVQSCQWVVGSIVAPFGGSLMVVGSARDEITDAFEADARNVAPRRPHINAQLESPSGEDEDL